MAQIWAGWTDDVLRDLRAPITAANEQFLTEWHGFELSGAQFNPLNTTLRVSGSTSYNSVGVQNYPTHAVGAQATADTLTNGFYLNIVAALREGDPFVYPLRSAVGVEITTWGTPNFAAAYLGRTSPPTPGPTFSVAPPAPGQSSIAGFHQVGLALGRGVPRNLHVSLRLRQQTLRNLSRLAKLGPHG